jgi:erythronate-4-phosphate dehydrogenase
MKTVCSHNMPFVEEAFRTLGETTIFDGRNITAAEVHDADLLAIRSTTKVNADLLNGSRVRFVGTATIGTDHLDIDYLERHNIHWCYSPGCNANGVSEYVTSVLLCLANRHGFALDGKTLGVIGVGNVGRLVVAKGEALGLRVLQNDPPRQRAEAPSDQFVSLDQLLAESDIVTTHVPITKDGLDPTYHMADSTFFARMRPDSIFVNAARGPVVDTEAMLSALASGPLAHVALDTWEGEPAIRRDTLQAVDLGSPHTAGYSFEGKVMGTVMVYREACRFLGVEATWTPDDLLPSPALPHVTVDAAGRSNEAVLWEVVRQLYDVEQEDAALRTDTPDPASHFDALRKNYHVRREFRFTTVRIINGTPQLRDAFTGLGFPVEV